MIFLIDSNTPLQRLQLREALAPHEHSSGLFPAEKAIDGDTSNFFHTSNGNGEGYPYPWLRVDLMNVGRVQRVIIFNRKDCCGGRLKDLEVRVGPTEVKKSKDHPITENSVCGIYSGPGSNGQRIVIDCVEAIESRYITLQLMSSENTILNLAEVEVYGQGMRIKQIMF